MSSCLHLCIFNVLFARCSLAELSLKCRCKLFLCIASICLIMLLFVSSWVVVNGKWSIHYSRNTCFSVKAKYGLLVLKNSAALCWWKCFLFLSFLSIWQIVTLGLYHPSTRLSCELNWTAMFPPCLERKSDLQETGNPSLAILYSLCKVIVNLRN